MQINYNQQLMDSLTELFEQNQDNCGCVKIDDDFKIELQKKIRFDQFPAKAAETKEVSILLSDLRGFTAMAEKYSPLTVIELLNRYFSKMSEIIYKNGGTIDKFMGDSIMVLFGAHEDTSSDMISTLTCAIEMQMAMNNINEISQSLGMANLYMGIGINTGEVVAGTLGSDMYREYTVIGDHVNIVSRVEAQSLRGQILITENTYKQGKSFIEVGEVNEVHVKGKSELVKMYELLAITKPERQEVPRREIRNSPRVEVHIPLHYSIIREKRVSPENRVGNIIDISYGGLFVLTDHEMQPFSEIKMVVSLSLMGTGTREIYARVLNSTRINGNFESHLEFTAIGENARKAIKAYVDKLI